MTRLRHRILIALDPAAPGDDALHALLAFGRSAQLELTGVFVEDSNLERLATLPFAREVRLSGQLSPSFTSLQLRDQLDACARDVERALEQARALLDARIQFQVLRGNALAELRRAALDMDWLVIGRSLKTAGARTWLGVTPEQLATAIASASAPVNLLFVHEPWASGRCVLVLDDGSDAGARAREQAGLMAQADAMPMEHCALDQLDRSTAGAAPAGNPQARLQQLCERLDPRVVVIPDTAAVRERLQLPELLETLHPSVAIIH